jgi:hypothetical protein
MNERQGKNGSANVAIHDVLYRQITSSSDEAIKVALGLVDEADKAAQKMVAECEIIQYCYGTYPSQLHPRGGRRVGMLAIGKCLKNQYDALATPMPRHLAVLVNQLEMQK